MIRLANKLNGLSELASIAEHAGVNADLISMICGKKIGAGGSRIVYEYNMNPKWVVKLEPLNTNSNITEAMLWDEIQGLKGNLSWVKDWFAPVHYISPNGKVLIMSRTFEKDKPRPKQVPKFLFDVKENNFGWIGDKFVCHDYGIIYGFIKYAKTFNKINW